MVWKGKQNININMNMHSPPAEGNFCDEQAKAVESLLLQDYNRHMRYVDKYNHMMISS
jgi:hypothetical protein